jgi:hypothetical protein
LHCEWKPSARKCFCILALKRTTMTGLHFLRSILILILIFLILPFAGLSWNYSDFTAKCWIRLFCSYRRPRWSSSACNWTQDSRVQTRPRSLNIKSDNNPQHDFLGKGSKAIGPMS